MRQYMLSVVTPHGPVPEQSFLDEVMRDVAAVEQEMKDAGAFVFSGGLEAPGTATVLRAERRGPDADVLLTDGPFIEGKEYLGGFSIVRAADRDEALEWGRKTARAIGLPIEVRPFHWSGEDG